MNFDNVNINADMVEEKSTMSDVVNIGIGGTSCLYTKTNRGQYITNLNNVNKYAKSNLFVWNGKEWTNTVCVKDECINEYYEVTLGSGETIRCTGNFKWQTEDDNMIQTSEMTIGSCLKTMSLPDSQFKQAVYLTSSMCKFIGVYLACGHINQDRIIVTINKEYDSNYIVDVINEVCCYIGCEVHINKSVDTYNAVINSKLLVTVLKQYIRGNGKNKHFTSNCLSLSNNRLNDIVTGFVMNKTTIKDIFENYSIEFTYNKNLERELRCIASRLGHYIYLYVTNYETNGKQYKRHKGCYKFINHPIDEVIKYNQVIRIEKIKAGNECFWGFKLDNENDCISLSSGIVVKVK